MAQGGYQVYPGRPSPDPKAVGTALVKKMAMKMERPTDPTDSGVAAAYPDMVNAGYDPATEYEAGKRAMVGDMEMSGPEDEQLAPASMAPEPTATNALNAGYYGDTGIPSATLAALGGALQRVENGVEPDPDPTHQLNQPNRFAQMLRLGLSDEEARLLTQTGGA